MRTTWTWPTGLGKFIGLLMALGAFGFALVGQLDVKEAVLIGGCGLAVVLV